MVENDRFSFEMGSSLDVVMNMTKKKKTGTIRILCRYLKRLLQSQTVDCFSTFNYIVSYVVVGWMERSAHFYYTSISMHFLIRHVWLYILDQCTFEPDAPLMHTFTTFTHINSNTLKPQKRNQKQHEMHTKAHTYIIHRIHIGHLKMRQQRKMWTREYTLSYDGMHKSSALPVEMCSSIFCYCFGISHFFSCPECVGGCKIMRAYVTISFNIQNKSTHTHLALYRSYCRFTQFSIVRKERTHALFCSMSLVLYYRSVFLSLFLICWPKNNVHTYHPCMSNSVLFAISYKSK